MSAAPAPARAVVHARSALVGNPSDGFGGATIALTLPSLRAVVTAAPARRVTLEAGGARISFDDASQLIAACRAGAYPPEGPLALALAAAKRFCERLADETDPGAVGFELVANDSTIPPRVGLAGSSAVVVGTLRALGELLEAPVPEDELPGLALACETDELGIAAGLQDRVVQTLGGLVFMDFDPAHPAGGRYERLEPDLLPPLAVWWLEGAGADSGATHQTVHERFARGDREVVATIEEIAALARAGREAIMRSDHAALGALMSRNFDLRREIYRLDPRHEALIQAARDHGVAANYTGSGGAIVALSTDPERTAALGEALERRGCRSLAL